MAGSESSRFMIGQRFRSAQSSCINDTQVVTNFMNGSGKQMKGIKDSIIVNGVMLTTTSHATRIVKNQTLTILIVDSVILDAILVGDRQSSIVFHVLSMDFEHHIMSEAQYALRSAATEFYL